MAMKPLVHVIDDEPAIRDSIRVLLSSMEMEVACYETAQAFIDAPQSTSPGCILLDLRMPGMSGLQLQRLYGEEKRIMPVIFLSGHADVETTVRAMHQGAVDFLVKPVNEEVLLEKVHSAIEQDRQRRAEDHQRSALQARHDLLSPREKQVLDGVFDGFSNKDIARQLRISRKTVELHRSNMMTKMHADSLAELVRMRMKLAAMASRSAE